MLNKKLTILVIISILAFTVSSAFTAPRPLNISLVSVDFRHEKGVTFKFQVTGDVHKNTLKGSILVNGKTVKLYCNDNGDPTPKVVVCTAQKATAARHSGSVAVVTLAGFSFRFIVPARP